MPKEKTKQKMSREFKLISVFVFLFILVLVFLFLLKPKYNEISQFKQEFKTKQEELANKKTYFENVKKLISNYQKINSQDIEKIAKVLPSEKDIAGLFVQIEALAEEAGLNLLGLDIAERKEVPELEKFKVRELGITLNLSGGDYFAFKKFLSAVESNLRIIDIDSINFAAEAESYALSLKTYYKE